MTHAADTALKAKMLDLIAMIHETDIDGNIRSANELLCRKTGYNAEEIIKGGYELICPEVTPVKSWLSLHALDADAGLYKGDTLNRARSGEDLWFSSTVTPLRNENGEPAGYLCVSIDITESRKLKEEFVRNGKLMQLGQLTATVAHEIRNPLGAIRTANFVLEKRLKGKVEGVEMQLERINNGIARCDKIITELLDFSRKKELKATPVTIDDWVTSVVEEERKNLLGTPKIEFELGMTGVEVGIDPDQMRQVLINLLSNAAEAMAEKSKKSIEGFQPKIKVRTRLSGDKATIAIQDNGPGIEPQHLNRIREPLFTTKSFGVGLGIPAIMKILENHGGGLDIESSVGEGARMTARFRAKAQVSSVA